MNPTLARWLLYSRSAVPFATAVLAVLLASTPFRLPYLAPVTPFFVLMAVYYWSIHRPEHMPALAIFAVGVLQDLITGGPPGSLALLLLLTHALTLSQRRILLGQSYVVEWAGFLLVAFGTAAAGWILACIYNTALVVPMPFGVQALLSVALYPVATWALAPARRLSHASEPA